MTHDQQALSVTQSSEHGLVSMDSAGSQALATRETAQIQSAIIQAKRFPRNEDQAFQKALKMAQRPNFAVDARYSRPQGGKDVTGPSVHLARALAACWGNVRVASQIIPDQPGWCTVEVTAIDLETNTQRTEQTRFKLQIYRKSKGTIDLSTSTEGFVDQETRSLTNRHKAFTERDATLKLLPRDYVEDVLDECAKTLRQQAAGELKANPDKVRKGLIAAFQSLGVSVEMLERKLEHPLKELTPEEVANLTAIGKSMKDGHTSRDDHFETSKTSPEADDLAAQMEAAVAKSSGKGKASKKEEANDEDVVVPAVTIETDPDGTKWEVFPDEHGEMVRLPYSPK